VVKALPIIEKWVAWNIERGDKLIPGENPRIGRQFQVISFFVIIIS